MVVDGSFHYEVEKAPNDEFGNKVTLVTCHGKLISETTGEMRDAIKPLLPQGGRIIVDLEDLSYLDSAGLGTLVGLKASAIKQGLCILEFSNMAPRILQLLRVTNLTDMLTSRA